LGALHKRTLQSEIRAGWRRRGTAGWERMDKSARHRASATRPETDHQATIVSIPRFQTCGSVTKRQRRRGTRSCLSQAVRSSAGVACPAAIRDEHTGRVIAVVDKNDCVGRLRKGARFAWRRKESMVAMPSGFSFHAKR
jgi:hypothetical protein